SETGEIGYVAEVIGTILYVTGLPSVKPQEIVYFETGEIGQAVSVTREHVEVLAYSKKLPRAGVKVTRSNQVLQVGVGPELLGHIVDPLGFALEQETTFKLKETRPVNITPPGIENRRKITRACETGVAMVDLIIPLGRGQRELVIGDRQTGKSIFLLKAALTQARAGSVCIYAAVGKKKQDIKLIEQFFVENKVMQNIIIVAATSEDALSNIYLCPYTAMMMAEYFRDNGKDVLVVLDDLTTHAKFYREIALLGRRFPGRNSYPGDIFYTHARLLERAGNFVNKDGTETSITCLPVVETVQGDLAGYIQTNLMSITDGHIYFDVDLFVNGKRPAINPFLSVTRVGRNTQTSLKRTLNREILSFLTLYEKVKTFVHFGTELNESVKATLSTGERIYAFFDQAPHSVTPLSMQLLLFAMLWGNMWNSKTVLEMKKDMDKLVDLYQKNQAFQKQVDTMLAGANTFNELLNTILKQTETFKKYITT
ncbi:MAG TPA: hypothetical protein VLF68_03960, partial [Candidatus Saccharimonadales bacterium]|nr:hypothetical protein [Candidatus Saccharimonadales bacterium]